MIGLKAVNCNTGDVLAEAQEQAAGKEAVLKALDSAAVSCAASWANRSARCRSTPPVEEATTPSLEALKAYSLKMLGQRETRRSAFLQAGGGLDPNFAVAYACLSALLRQPRRNRAGGENIREGVRTARESERAGAVLHETNYYEVGTRELEKAVRLSTVAADLPEGLQACQATGGYLRDVGNQEKALEQAGRRCNWGRTLWTTLHASPPLRKPQPAGRG